VSADPNPLYDLPRWWRTKDGLVVVFNGYFKLAFYGFEYDIAPF